MKKVVFLLLPFLSMAQPGPAYWQQEVHYKMDIDFDVEKHQFSGQQELIYTNNSPDTLRVVYYHLYFNAFQPGSMMDERSRSIADPDKRVGDRISKLQPEEIGYHRINMLSQDGAQLNYTITQTVMKVDLAEPVLPGNSTVLKLDFSSQVPVQIRRSGRNNAEGVDYTMTQWYPKLAAYDEDGWHPDPYVGREFYGEFGTFDVDIHISHNYILGGTGELKNAEAVWSLKKEKKGISTYKLNPSKMDKRLWSFHAENVHDFAWAADPDFIRKSSQGSAGVQLNYYYLPKYDSTWERLPEYTEQFFSLMNKQFGQYAYPQFSVIQGGDGGMEYPMCTMLKGTGKMEGLIGVMVHEAAHNWFYGMLASNENQYPWMDEGFTSFAEAEILHEMGIEEGDHPHIGAYNNYAYILKKDALEALSTPADYFHKNMAYGISSYSRGELFLSQLRYIIGESAFEKTMLRYFDEWKFKHPDPWDFLRVAERQSGIELDWYLNFWMNTVKTIDYGIASVDVRGRGVAEITLERIGQMPMPVDISIRLKDGSSRNYNIRLLMMQAYKQDDNFLPAGIWPWTNPTFTLLTDIPFSAIEEIVIDPKMEMADMDRSNNTYKPEAEVD